MDKKPIDITYDFLKIANDRKLIKSLFNTAYSIFSNKKTDNDYFGKLFEINNCYFSPVKLSKKYKRNKIALLPIEYNDGKFNKYPDSVIKDFLAPIVAKMMNIVFDKYNEIDFYNTFKYKYFIPILEAEYTRMSRENLDYNNEKPFIICIESAISSFLADKEYNNRINDKILKTLKKSLKNFKFYNVSFPQCNSLKIISEPHKLLDYFSITFLISDLEKTKIKSNEKFSVDVSNTGADITDKYCVNLEDVNYSLPRILDYILTMCYVKIIREYSIKDVTSSMSDDVIENIKNELFIYNSRTAKVIKDYLIHFKSNYDKLIQMNSKQLSYKLISDMMKCINVSEENEYLDDKIEKYKERDPVSESVSATSLLYSMISSIESMNRDYMKTDNKFIVDAAYLHDVYESIAKNMRNMVTIRNDFFNLVYLNSSIFTDEYYKGNKKYKAYIKVNEFFNHCINLAIMYSETKGSIRDDGTYIKNNIINHLVDEFRCLYVYECKNRMLMMPSSEFDLKYKFDQTKYTELIENVFSMIENMAVSIGSISDLYIDHVFRDVEHWMYTMENNVRYYQYFDSVKEFNHYISTILVLEDDFDFYTFDFFERPVGSL